MIVAKVTCELGPIILTGFVTDAEILEAVLDAAARPVIVIDTRRAVVHADTDAAEGRAIMQDQPVTAADDGASP
jgi:hypothetical protein